MQLQWDEHLTSDTLMKEVVIPKASLKPKPTPKQRRPLKSFKAQEINKASSKTPEPTKEFPLKQRSQNKNDAVLDSIADDIVLVSAVTHARKQCGAN